jgi:hypothetical protein
MLTSATISSLKATKFAHRMANDVVNPPTPHEWPVQANAWPRGASRPDLRDAPLDDSPEYMSPSFVPTRTELLTFASIVAFMGTAWLLIWWRSH